MDKGLKTSDCYLFSTSLVAPLDAFLAAVSESDSRGCRQAGVINRRLEERSFVGDATFNGGVLRVRNKFTKELIQPDTYFACECVCVDKLINPP